jgi:hypothetical protein
MPSLTPIAVAALLSICALYYIVRAFNPLNYRRLAAAAFFTAALALFSAPHVAGYAPSWWLFPSTLAAAALFAVLCLVGDREGYTSLSLSKGDGEPSPRRPAGQARRLPSSPSFTGNLIGIPLVDVLQLIGLSQKTGTLLVLLERGRFSLTFARGLLVAAEATPFRAASDRPEGRPRLAAVPPRSVEERRAQLTLVVGRLLRLQTGVFNFQQAGDDAEPPAHALSIESLLLDALREEDESRERAAAGSPKTR